MGERAASCMTIGIQRITSFVSLWHILVASKRAAIVHIHFGKPKNLEFIAKGSRKNSFLRLISMLEFR